MPSVENSKFERRRFLKGAALVGAAVPLGGSVLAACGAAGPAPAVTRPLPAGTVPPEYLASGKTTLPADAHAGSAGQATHAGDIDAMHKKGVDQFLANIKSPITRGKGNVPLAPVIDNGVKVFNLTMDEVEWEVSPGQKEKARGYNAMIPGPVLRATEGERVRIVVKNNLTESSSIHFHGLVVPNNMDGVPFITQDPIKAGTTYTYEFTLRNSGTHMYHSHHNALDQVNRGLLGAFIVDPKDPATYPKYDKEFILVLNDVSLGFTINGKGFPATDAIVVNKGDRVLLRWLNEGLLNHPMHLHGMPMQVFAQDGYALANPYYCDTLDVPPGNRFDCLVEASEPGVWAFHCHILSHAEGSEGMFGLVTAMIVA